MAHGIKMRSLGRLPPQPAFLWLPKLNAIKIRLLNGVKTILNILDSVCRAVDAPRVALGLPIRNILDSVCRQVADTFVALGPPVLCLLLLLFICLDTYVWTPMLGHLCLLLLLGTETRTLLVLGQKKGFKSVPSLGRDPTLNQTVWGPRAGLMLLLA